jgi:hypothetical protein
VLVRRDGEHISVFGLKRTLAMGIFEPLIEHSDGKPPEHPLDVVADPRSAAGCGAAGRGAAGVGRVDLFD